MTYRGECLPAAPHGPCSRQALDHREANLLEAATEVNSSRAAISASMSVRKNSSDAQRCVLAAWQTSGAMTRMRASLSRRSPATRSSVNAGAAASSDLLQRVRAQRSDGDLGQIQVQGFARWRGIGGDPPGGQDVADNLGFEPTYARRSF